MENIESAPLTSYAPVSDVLTELITGKAPLKVALDLWKSRHGLRYGDVSGLIGRQPGAVSAWIHRPAVLPRIGSDVAKLIGYSERPRGAA